MSGHYSDLVVHPMSGVTNGSPGTACSWRCLSDSAINCRMNSMATLYWSAKVKIKVYMHVKLQLY